MAYEEIYKGYTIKGYPRNYRTYDSYGNEVGLFDDSLTTTLGGLRKQIRTRIDTLTN
jgi:hypothetical protein